MRAPRWEINPRTRGRFLVRVMRASYFGSKSILNAFAEAQERNVPVVRNRNVNVEVDSVVFASTTDVLRMSGIGYSEYADVVVRRIRNDSRGFERERYVVNRRRKVADCGNAAAVVVKRDDASNGSWSSAVDGCSCSACAFFCSRRRL